VSAERFRWSQGSVTASGPVRRREANGFGRDRLGVNPSSRTRRVVSRVNQQCAGITLPAACEGGEPALSCVSSDQWGGAKSGVHPLRRRADACRTRETEPNEGKHAGGDALSWLVGRALGAERTVAKPNYGDRNTSWGVVRSARRPITLLASLSRGEQLAGRARGWQWGS
jgi:hypothetical protein